MNISTVSFRTSNKYFLHVYRKHIKHYKWQPALHLIQQLERGLGKWVTQPSPGIMADKCHICNDSSIIMLTITHMQIIYLCIYLYTNMYFYKHMYLYTFTDVSNAFFYAAWIFKYWWYKPGNYILHLATNNVPGKSQSTTTTTLRLSFKCKFPYGQESKQREM